MPLSLCTAFTELREYAQLQNQYHDGTVQRSQLAQTSRRTFRLSKRLSASQLSALYSFWGSQNGGLTPFAFYNPFDVPAGQQIGSNYDPRQQHAGAGDRGVPRQLGAGYRPCKVECAGAGVDRSSLMRLTSVLCFTCPCGRQLEIPDTQRVLLCTCGRTLVVEAIRNDDLMVVPSGSASPTSSH